MSAADTVRDWPHLFTPGDADAPVLLLLHGTGGNEQEISALAPELDPRAAVLAPRGRVREQGMPRWFRRLGEGVFDVDDVVARAGELAGFVTAARAHHGLVGRPLVAVGFSNGANIALATAMLHPDVLDRVVAFSGMYPFADRDEAVSLDGVQVTTLNGREDPMAPLESVTRLVEVLRDRGADVEQHLRAGGHGIFPQDLARGREAVARAS
ncbi:alpha/beta hydrolase [Ornithinimicrobium kibberense]|uniref:Alpha/beta hydrolase n=1 Tax=Ornithinimicrobium kibberense TaxID=282060 RepID=A0ABV5V6F0_9MICO|nr:alpha/beta hydrolase [Ornithinimicrobium kibberense]